MILVVKKSQKSQPTRDFAFSLDFSKHLPIHQPFIIYISSMKKYLAEALWVLLFVLVIGLSGDPLAIGVCLAILVYATGPISWGHLNPAVTLSLLVGKKIRTTEAVNYWVAQLVGALLWALLYRALKGNTIAIMPADGVAMRRAWLGEFIFTFMLAMVVYLTAVSKKVEWNSYRGAAIGLTVFVAAVSVGRMTGWAFNPAVSTGSILIDWIHGGDSGMYLWMYLVATLLGGFVAGHVARGLREHTTTA